MLSICFNALYSISTSHVFSVCRYTNNTMGGQYAIPRPLESTFKKKMSGRFWRKPLGFGFRLSAGMGHNRDSSRRGSMWGQGDHAHEPVFYGLQCEHVNLHMCLRNLTLNTYRAGVYPFWCQHLGKLDRICHDAIAFRCIPGSFM